MDGFLISHVRVLKIAQALTSCELLIFSTGLYFNN